ncbi:MAG: hypothetical protein ACI8WB_005181 [Phenylobacterium sp.]|jgi:hypothetical protein
MTLKTVLSALVLSAVTSQVLANEQDIATLDAKVSEKVAHIKRVTNNLVVPDAIEIEEIKMKMIGKEIADTGASIPSVVSKYNLDGAQKRQVIIIVYSGDGGGDEPK